MNKPPFDPNQPYEEVNDKPAFDPYQPYEAVNETPVLDTALRTMTGSFNPNPPMVVPPEIGKIPYTSGQEAGANVSRMFAEGMGRRGHPILGATLGTAGYVAPLAMQTLMMPDIPVPMWMSKGAGKVGNVLAGGVEKVVGVPASSIKSVFNKPLSLVTAPWKKDVATAYAKSEIPKTAGVLKNIIEEGSAGTALFVRRGSKALENYIENGVQDARTILQARHAIDQEIALLENQVRIARRGTRSSIQQKIDAKERLRQTFNRALDQMAPQHRVADALYAQRAEVAPFRELTLPGKINLFSPEGLARAVPGLPTVLGGTTALAGGAKKILSRPTKLATATAGIGRMLTSNPPEIEDQTPVSETVNKNQPSILNRIGGSILKNMTKPPMPGFAPASFNPEGEEGQVLTKDKAMEFVTQARQELPNASVEEIKNLARKKARQAGFQF